MNAPATQLDNSILFSPGRLVQGDLYEPNTKDMKGNPLVVQSGPNKGQPRVEYFFKVAIPKTAAQWWSEPWGAKVLALANSYWPQGQASSPKFSWKIENGDDDQPNFDRGGRKNCDTEGFRGCWVVKFSSGFATKILNSDGVPMVEPGLVKRGFWIEVLGTINSNNDPVKSGIFMNHNMVAFRAPDKEIVSGPDPRSVGFGKAPLPAGISAAPVAGAAFPGAMGTPAMPGVPAGYPMTPGAMPAATPTLAAPAMPAASQAPPVAVQPHAGFINPGAPSAPAGVPVMPSAAGVPPVPGLAPAVQADPLGAPAGFRMANPAGGTYAAFIGGGWNDAAMIAQGHMVRL